MLSILRFLEELDHEVAFLALLAVVFVLYSMKLVRVIMSLSWFERGLCTDLDDIAHFPKMLLLIPMFKEATIAEDTLLHFSTLSYPTGSLSIVIVTTEREKCPVAPCETTHDVVSRVLDTIQCENMTVLRTSSRTTCKADQLSEALSILEGRGKIQDPYTFIGVYDADSRPDRRTLLYLAKHCASRSESGSKPCVYQQVPLYLSNTPDIKNLLLYTRPYLHNALYFFSSELPHFLQSSGFSRWFDLLCCGPTAFHLIGHGEFVRKDVLEAAGGFRPPSCDTTLGFSLALRGVPVEPVPFIDNSESPHELAVFLQQNKVWFNGMTLFFREAWRLRREVPILSLAYMSGRLLNDLFSWGLYPFIWLLLLSVSVRTFGPEVSFAAVAVFFLPLASVFLIARSLARVKREIDSEVLLRLPRTRTLLLAPVLYPSQRVLNAIGPWIWLSDRIASVIARREISLVKTRRSNQGDPTEGGTW